MKQLLFVDNDNQRLAEKDLHIVKDCLILQGDLPQEYVDNMVVVADFAHLSREEKAKLVFNPQWAICTFSMYTATHYNSIGQLTALLNMAGVTDVRGLVYLDVSGNLPEDLGRELPDNEDTFAILNAIETNFIVTFSDGDCHRVRVNLDGMYNKPFRLEPIDLEQLLLGEG